MFEWLTQKKMVGGLVFGPPGWMAERIEETFDAAAGQGVGEEKGVADGKAAAGDRAGLKGVLEKIGLGRASGLVPGLGEQLSEAKSRLIRTLVVTMLPSQPEFVLGPAMSRLAMGDVMAGVEAIEKAVVPRRTVVVLDRHDLKTYRVWRRAIRARKDGGGGVRVEIKMLVNRYPQADPTMLTRTLFGEKLAAGALPTRVGRLMVDPVTCWGLGRYIRMGAAFTDRPVQLITDDGSAPRLVMGRLGEKVGDFCKRYGVEVGTQQVIVNGMLTGREVDPKVERIGGNTESVAIREPVEAGIPTACLACGWCVDVCPTALTPVHFMQLAQMTPKGGTPKAGVARSASAREALHCIACGLCTYVCPTRLPLMEETLRLREFVESAQQNGKKEGGA